MIREATLADLPRIVEMGMRFIETVDAYRGVLTANPERLERVSKFVIEGNGIILLAEKAGVVVGMIVVAALEHPFTGEFYGDEQAWWIDPEHRSGRLAYYLLRTAIDWSRQNGLSVLKMVAPAGSNIGTFYELLGFRLVEHTYQLQL